MFVAKRRSRLATNAKSSRVIDKWKREKKSSKRYGARSCGRSSPNSVIDELRLKYFQSKPHLEDTIVDDEEGAARVRVNKLVGQRVRYGCFTHTVDRVILREGRLNITVAAA